MYQQILKKAINKNGDSRSPEHGSPSNSSIEYIYSQGLNERHSLILYLVFQSLSLIKQIC